MSDLLETAIEVAIEAVTTLVVDIIKLCVEATASHRQQSSGGNLND